MSTIQIFNQINTGDDEQNLRNAIKRGAVWFNLSYCDDPLMPWVMGLFSDVQRLMTLLDALGYEGGTHLIKTVPMPGDQIMMHLDVVAIAEHFAG